MFIQANMSLRNSVIGAIEHTMQDFIVPIRERAVKIAVVTCEQIIKKVRIFSFSLFKYINPRLYTQVEEKYM